MNRKNITRGKENIRFYSSEIEELAKFMYIMKKNNTFTFLLFAFFSFTFLLFTFTFSLALVMACPG